MYQPAQNGIMEKETKDRAKIPIPVDRRNNFTSICMFLTVR
jgi:hypothetical protein